ncbi:hypothetical protein KAU11_06720, partial [Candidatus Babeliales bacterium]|nr:hypothetical protein [Candidatus Babeliales bacterium]
MNKWTGYNIDHDYGVAVVLTNQKVKDPLELFYELAEQCFGIRKSIGETKLLNTFDDIDFDSISLPEDNSMENHPELYDNPLSKMVKTMSPNHFMVARKYEKEAKY